MNKDSYYWYVGTIEYLETVEVLCTRKKLVFEVHIIDPVKRHVENLLPDKFNFGKPCEFQFSLNFFMQISVAVTTEGVVVNRGFA